MGKWIDDLYLVLTLLSGGKPIVIKSCCFLNVYFFFTCVQVCEATFLIANYMEAYEGPKMNAYDI